MKHNIFPDRKGDILEWSQLLFAVIVAIMVFYSAVVLASTTTHEAEQAQREQRQAMDNVYLLTHYLSLPVEIPLQEGRIKATMAELLDIALHNSDYALFAKGRTEEFFFRYYGREVGTWKVRAEGRGNSLTFGTLEGASTTATTVTLPSANPPAHVRITLIMLKEGAS